MRIKKVSQTSGYVGTVSNSYSGSTTDTYSCDYVNNLNTITTGSGTMNSSYVSSTEHNHWERNGQVVSYSFTFTTSGGWGDTTILVSGLPKAKNATRFLALNAVTNVPLRLAITGSGTIINQYSVTKPSSGNVIEGQVTYITKD